MEEEEEEIEAEVKEEQEEVDEKIPFLIGRTEPWQRARLDAPYGHQVDKIGERSERTQTHTDTNKRR